MSPALAGWAAPLGYILGSIPFGLLLTRLGGAGDLRTIGSGNIGATNVLRTGRKGLAAATLLLDGAKAALAVALGRWLAGEAGAAIAAACSVLGHVAPVWLRFRGGKGVASGLGALLVLAPPAGGLGCLVWLMAARLSRISSLAALIAFAIMPPAAFLLRGDPVGTAALAISLLIFWRHRGNIDRLRRGMEPRIGEGR